MSDVRGYGRYLGMIGQASDQIGLPGIYPADNATPLLADWTWQPGPPRPVDIPYAWLLAATGPLRSKPDKPLTSAAVSVAGGATAQAESAASIAAFGDQAFSATLYTATPGDGPTLADWIVAYYATPPDEVPRARFPSLTLRLNHRTMPERQRIMAVTLGTRIRITDVPATWPEGAAHQVVEGITHNRGRGSGPGGVADVAWKTAPVVGNAPGVEGPWFRLDVPYTGTDILF